MSNTDNSLESTLEGINLGLKVAETAIKHLEEGRLELQRRRKKIYEQLAQEDPERIFVSHYWSEMGRLNPEARRLTAVLYYAVRQLEAPISPRWGVLSLIPDEDHKKLEECTASLMDQGYFTLDLDGNLIIS